MKKVLIACLAIGTVGLMSSTPVEAQVVFQTPGVTIETGPQPYWRQHQEAQWQRREEFREAEHNRIEWQRDHCIRDWGGQELCRR